MPLVQGPHCELRQRTVCEPSPSFPVDGQFAPTVWILGGRGGGGGGQDSTFSEKATVLPSGEGLRQIIHKPPPPGSLVVISAFPGK